VIFLPAVRDLVEWWSIRDTKRVGFKSFAPVRLFYLVCLDRMILF